MTSEEMNLLKTDFNAFMENAGYLRIDEYAKRINLTRASVCNWMHNNLIPKDALIRAGNVLYISKDFKKPTKDKSKIERTGRYRGMLG